MTVITYKSAGLPTGTLVKMPMIRLVRAKLTHAECQHSFAPIEYSSIAPDYIDRSWIVNPKSFPIVIVDPPGEVPVPVARSLFGGKHNRPDNNCNG